MHPFRTRLYSFLRWSEKYTKTDMVYLTSGGFWLFFGQVVTTLASLALAVAFANLIEPEKYGNYKYVLSLAGIIGAFSLTGLTTAVTRAIARGNDSTLPYAFRMSLAWSIGMVLISCVGALYYFTQNNYFLSWSLVIIGATSPLISAASLYRPFLMGKKKFKLASLFGIAQGLVPTVLVLLGIIINLPLLALVVLYFFSTTIALLVLYITATHYIENNVVDTDTTNHLSKHLSFMGILNGVSTKLDSVLIFQLLGGTELAIFSLAITMPDTIKGSMKNIDTLAVPKFVGKTKSEMKKAVWSKTVIIFLALLAVAGAYVVFAPFIFELLFPKYLDSVIYSQVYALIIPLSFVLASAYFDSQAAVRERYILSVSNNIVRIVTVVIGILFFGLWGAIGARLIARVINVTLSGWLIHQN